MKAAVISLGSKSSQWTAEEMKKQFSEVDMLDLKMLEIQFGQKEVLLYKGKSLGSYDCVYAKGSFRYAALLKAICDYLGGNAFVPVAGTAFGIAHNKMLTHVHLQKANIPMPLTYVFPTLEAARLTLKKLSYPVVMKFQQGTHGKGVMFADSYSSASSILDALGALKQPFLIQEYVDTGGTDVRAFVVGDDVVAAMRRTAKSDEKRANIHAGGEGSAHVIDRVAKKIAVEAAKAIGAGICGVDILQGPRGPLVLEVNVSPGLQGITKATGVNIAGKIAQYLARSTEDFLKQKKAPSAQDLISEANPRKGGEKQIITNLLFKGDRIYLPELITKTTGFNERDNYTITAEKGKLTIEEFKVS